MRSILKSVLTIAAVLTLSISATSAYFTDQAETAGQVFTSGTLNVALSETAPFASELLPGESSYSEFTVENTGSLPIHIQGYFAGAWSNPELSLDVISYGDLEEFVGGVWVPVPGANNLSAGDMFEYRDSEANLVEIPQGQLRIFRASLGLSETAGNEYQNQQYSTNFHMAAKQATTGSQWPAEY